MAIVLLTCVIVNPGSRDEPVAEVMVEEPLIQLPWINILQHIMPVVQYNVIAARPATTISGVISEFTNTGRPKTAMLLFTGIIAEITFVFYRSRISWCQGRLVPSIAIGIVFPCCYVGVVATVIAKFRKLRGM